MLFACIKKKINKKSMIQLKLSNSFNKIFMALGKLNKIKKRLAF